MVVIIIFPFPWFQPMSCTRDTCSGSSMDLFLKDEEKGISKADMIRRGKAFITDFYKDTGK